MKKLTEKNALLYVKENKGKLYYYIDVELPNGKVVEKVAIKLAFYNVKLDYLVKHNLNEKVEA